MHSLPFSLSGRGWLQTPLGWPQPGICPLRVSALSLDGSWPLSLAANSQPSVSVCWGGTGQPGLREAALRLPQSQLSHGCIPHGQHPSPAVHCQPPRGPGPLRRLLMGVRAAGRGASWLSQGCVLTACAGVRLAGLKSLKRL